MLNSVLLVLALPVTVGAGWVAIRKNRAAAPAVAMAGVLLVAALGGPVWEWAKAAGGAGLPPHVTAPQFDQSLAARAFLIAAIGAGLAAFFLPRADVSIDASESEWRPSDRTKAVLLAITAIGFILWLAGVGPAFLNREFYGQYNGSGFLLRAAFPLSMIVGLILLAASGDVESKRLRWAIYGISIAWFIGLTCMGSRTALAYPIVAAVLVFRHGLSLRRLNLGAVAAGFSLIALAIFTFAVVLQARSMPHGILNIPSVISTVWQNSASSTDSYLLPLKQLLASIFASVPVAEQSAKYDIGLNVLIGNANVMPGTAQPMELERYWPYEWVPLSFAGCWFGATGWMGQIVVFGAMSWVCCYTSHNLNRSRFGFVSFVGLICSLLIAVLAIQYSSRMVWRVFSMAVVACSCAYLVRERRSYGTVDAGDVSGRAARAVLPTVSR